MEIVSRIQMEVGKQIIFIKIIERCPIARQLIDNVDKSEFYNAAVRA